MRKLYLGFFIIIGCDGPLQNWEPITVPSDQEISNEIVFDAGSLALEDDEAISTLDSGVLEPSDSDPSSAADFALEPNFQIEYPTEQLYLPFTEKLVERWRSITGSNSSLPGSVFMKVGASSFASSRTLHCLADEMLWEELSAEEEETLSHFKSGEAAGNNPFQRSSLVVRSGRTAAWAIAGDPSPLEQEITALSPSMALIEYGTNDMQMGLTYASAMWNFYSSLNILVLELMNQQILPVVHTIRFRADVAQAGYWVKTYNQIIRGIAQKYQIPFIDQYNALMPLPQAGLAGDGVHASYYSDGDGIDACNFTEEGLQFGYNRRNRLTLSWLTELYTSWDLGSITVSPLPEVALVGDYEMPIELLPPPFVHAGNTSLSEISDRDSYEECGSTADESGPEIVYEFSLSEATPLRFIVFSDEGVDIDLHVMRYGDDGLECRARADRLLEGTLPAGTYVLILDSYVSQGVVFAGKYLLSVLPCDANDSDCQNAL